MQTYEKPVHIIAQPATKNAYHVLVQHETRQSACKPISMHTHNHTGRTRTGTCAQRDLCANNDEENVIHSGKTYKHAPRIIAHTYSSTQAAVHTRTYTHIYAHIHLKNHLFTAGTHTCRRTQINTASMHSCTRRQTIPGTDARMNTGTTTNTQR